MLDKSDAELKEYLTEVIDDYNVYTGGKINGNLIKHAITEAKKIKEELNFNEIRLNGIIKMKNNKI